MYGVLLVFAAFSLTLRHVVESLLSHDVSLTTSCRGILYFYSSSRSNTFNNYNVILLDFDHGYYYYHYLIIIKFIHNNVT